MGNSPLCQLTADAESPTEPGKFSVISDEIKADYDALYDEVVSYCKYLVDPQMEKVLKELKIEDLGPDEFSVKIILDGAKLTAYGVGNPERPGTDAVASYNKYKLDKAGRKLTSQLYGPATGFFWLDELDKYENMVRLNSTTNFLKDPLRIEYYWETTEDPPNMMPPSSRVANETVKGVLSPILEGVLAKFANLKVVTTPDAPSVAAPGEKSVISNTLNADEVSFTAIMDGIVECIKEDTEGSPVFKEVTETDFTESFTKTYGDNDMVRIFECDKRKGTIKVDTKLKSGSGGIEHHLLHQSPLQFEAWTIDDSTRKAGVAFSRQCQVLWNKAYAKATSSSSWFSW